METQTLRRFAFVPVLMDDGTWCFLAWYLRTERHLPAFDDDWGEHWEVVSLVPAHR